MERKYMKYLNKGVMGAAIIAGCSACTDTVDDHYGVNGGVAKNTLWEQIAAQENLSDFAQVLEKVHYYSNENKSTGMTYKELLQKNTKMTVWAPVNGSFDLQQVLADIERNEYSVDNRFVRNHINTFSRIITGAEQDSITMLNSKMNVLDNQTATFKGINVIQKNIPATNGTLHIIETEVPFLNNMYEMLQTNTSLTSLYNFFHDRDTTFIDENASVQGGIVNGEVTWADTVLVTESKAFQGVYSYRGKQWNGIAANLKNEDSTWVMVLPTDAGWQKAVEKTKPYYTYMSFPYVNKDDKNQQPKAVDPDTLQKYGVELAIVNRLVFSPNRQKDYNLEDFGQTDSLFTTNGAVIKAPYCNDIFQGITPLKVSNGLAYITDDYRYNVSEDLETEGESYFALYPDGMNTSTKVGTSKLTSANRNPNVSGSISENTYAYTIPLAPRTPTNIAFKLQGVLSAKYDVYAVIVPENIQDTLKTALPLKFKAGITYYNGKDALEVTQQTDNIICSQEPKVDTVPLFENFQFPVAYAGVEHAYPILTLTVTANGREINKKYTNSIYVDKIILKTKEE